MLDRPIEELLSEGETLRVEFKRQIEDRDLVKAVACLANGGGGTLLIGVDDDGTVVGAKPRHGDTTIPARVAALIQNQTIPPLPTQVEMTAANEVPIIRIDVEPANPGPVSTKDGVFTKRTLDPHGRPLCTPMSVHEILSMGMTLQGTDYATSPARGASPDDLDPAEFARFRRLCRITNDSAQHLSDQDVLMALGLCPPSKEITLGSILLFGTPESLTRWTPSAEVLLQDMRRGRETTIRLMSPLFRAAEEIHAWLEERNEDTEIMVGLHRAVVPLLPVVTRREAVANALVHRDYSQLGPISIQISDTSFTVASQGGLPPGVNLENLLSQSRPRSVALADAFRRAGLVERRGKGINDMFEQQLRAGRDAPDYGASTPDSVVMSVPLGHADIDLVRFLITFEDQHQKPLALDELRVVHEVRLEGAATTRDLADTLMIPVSQARAICTQLTERGILEVRGAGRSRRYHLTSRFFDLAEDRNAYVRVKPIEPLQMERMIMDYVTAYGDITRGRAAELCQVTPAQARELLKGLITRGRLELVGERRGARYVTPSRSVRRDP